MQFPLIYQLWYGAIILTTVYRQNANIEKMYVYASELRKFWNFYILKLLFLSIFCRYIRYFVGTNDMLFGLHVYTDNFPNVPTKVRKGIIGGGGGQLPPCPPPPLATLMALILGAGAAA